MDSTAVLALIIMPLGWACQVARTALGAIDMALLTT